MIHPCGELMPLQIMTFTFHEPGTYSSIYLRLVSLNNVFGLYNCLLLVFKVEILYTFYHIYSEMCVVFFYVVVNVLNIIFSLLLVYSSTTCFYLSGIWKTCKLHLIFLMICYTLLSDLYLK